MTFFLQFGAERRRFLSLIKWIHNDFMYVKFGGIRNTRPWSKST